VVEDMVVVGKVVGGDDVDAGILLDLPVGETEPLGLGEELILGELASPVGLVGLLEITENTNAALGGGSAYQLFRSQKTRKRPTETPTRRKTPS
jgi:hypothetical protein